MRSAGSLKWLRANEQFESYVGHGVCPDQEYHSAGVNAGTQDRGRSTNLRKGNPHMRLITLLLLITPMVLNAQRPSTMAHRSAVYAPNGVVATSQPLATAAGLAVLQRGGNAIDAAVTAAAVLSVTEPHMTGIGGDLFAIVWSARDRKMYGLNASGRSGSLMTRAELIKRGRQSIAGVEAVTVPGALSGWDALLQRFGTLRLADALAPAIQHADQGFPVTPIIASDWDAEVPKLKRDRGAAATYLVAGERAPKAGEWFRNPEYARTLRTIAAGGTDAYYKGELGERIAGHVRELGGFLTKEDFAAHSVEWLEPISVAFRGYRLWELPPNGQGIAALEMLGILDGYDLAAMGHNSAEYLHHLIEAKKLAYADLETFIADPATMQVKTSALLSDAYIAKRRQLLEANRAAERAQPGPSITESETIYLTASDAAGNMVSLINSNFAAFGSGVAVPGTGFILQNRGGGFTLEDGHVNVVAPRKRPLHTLIPGFVTKTSDQGVEEPWMSFGVMGGSMQPQGHVQVLLNVLLFGMDIQQAIDAPRFRHSSGRAVAIERVVGDDVRTRLRALGHDVSEGNPRSMGGAQAIIRLSKGWVAGSDPRKDGMAAGH
jgi:gamma-glutamyltranspeptidase/glutathione hydrolase